MTQEKQGVISTISFPIGQDELAVSRAIHELLQEKWEFVSLDKKEIKLMRTWEVDVTELPQLTPETESLWPSLTVLSNIVRQYIYLENDKWVLHDNGADKIALAIKEYLERML